MVKGTRSAEQFLKAARRAAKARGYVVVRLPKRGKGSHTIWEIEDAHGNRLARFGLTGHAGQMTQTVTRSNEKNLEGLFGKGWLDR